MDKTSADKIRNHDISVSQSTNNLRSRKSAFHWLLMKQLSRSHLFARILALPYQPIKPRLDRIRKIHHYSNKNTAIWRPRRWENCEMRLDVVVLPER